MEQTKTKDEIQCLKFGLHTSLYYKCRLLYLLYSQKQTNFYIDYQYKI